MSFGVVLLAVCGLSVVDIQKGAEELSVEMKELCDEVGFVYYLIIARLYDLDPKLNKNERTYTLRQSQKCEIGDLPSCSFLFLPFSPLPSFSYPFFLCLFFLFFACFFSFFFFPFLFSLFRFFLFFLPRLTMVLGYHPRKMFGNKDACR